MVARLPAVPAEMAWIEAFRTPVIMDCTRARTKLGWDPKYSSRETLEEMVTALRDRGVI